MWNRDIDIKLSCQCSHTSQRTMKMDAAVTPQHCYLSMRLHGITLQKTVILTAVYINRYPHFF